MMSPIDFGNVVEDGAEDVVAIDAIIERINECFDVLICNNIVQC